MLLLRNPDEPETQEGAINAMNTLAILYVDTHLRDLLDEAAERHMHRVERPSLFQRISSAASNALVDLTMPMDNRGWMFPKLDDSPNRS